MKADLQKVGGVDDVADDVDDVGDALEDPGRVSHAGQSGQHHGGCDDHHGGRESRAGLAATDGPPGSTAMRLGAAAGGSATVTALETAARLAVSSAHASTAPHA